MAPDPTHPGEMADIDNLKFVIELEYQQTGDPEGGDSRPGDDHRAERDERAMRDREERNAKWQTERDELREREREQARIDRSFADFQKRVQKERRLELRERERAAQKKERQDKRRRDRRARVGNRALSAAPQVAANPLSFGFGALTGAASAAFPPAVIGLIAFETFKQIRDQYFGPGGPGDTRLKDNRRGPGERLPDAAAARGSQPRRADNPHQHAWIAARRGRG